MGEAEVLRAISPNAAITATPGASIKMWYNDEHAATLGIRRVIVKTKTGSTQTDYPVTAYPGSPSRAVSPKVGTTALDGDQAGTDTAVCAGHPDLCDRPIFPALFLTDVTANAASKAGDWQAGGTPIPPSAIFGSWKAGVRIIDRTKSQPTVSILSDTDPAKNGWNLGGGDAPPAGLKDEGYGFEARWTVDDLVAAGLMIPGHTYRFEVMVHDGDQHQNGGDGGEACGTVAMPACLTDADCNDQNACTTDACNGGTCVHGTISCDDHDARTTDSCTAGSGCTHTPISCDDGNACTVDIADPQQGCLHTTTSCDDHDACTADSCDPTRGCQHGAISCDDGDATTADSCDATAGCIHTSIACDDGNACTTDVADRHLGCVHSAISCDDHDACTFDACDPTRGCTHTLQPGCTSCTTNLDCFDDNACSTDVCDAGTCRHTLAQGCIPCDSAADCTASNACATATCDGGRCGEVVAPDCTPCTTDAECDDHDGGTLDACTNGRCSHTPIEVCDDGIDNDRNGLTDCQDPACAASPACAGHEICGDGIDNDGDGLVDFEDPDCCPVTGPLGLRVTVLRKSPRGNQDRLKLRAVFATQRPAGFNPLTEDTSVQISDAQGQVFGTTIAAMHWMPMGKRVVSFWDANIATANGLSDGKFIMKKNGKIIFHTHGHDARTRPNPDPGLTIVVRNGNYCARTSTTLQVRPAGLVLHR